MGQAEEGKDWLTGVPLQAGPTGAARAHLLGESGSAGGNESAGRINHDRYEHGARRGHAGTGKQNEGTAHHAARVRVQIARTGGQRGAEEHVLGSMMPWVDS